MLENPEPEIVSWELSNPQEGTEEFFGPELISTEETTGVRQEADLNWNLSELTGAAAQSEVETMVQSDWGLKVLPDDPAVRSWKAGMSVIMTATSRTLSVSSASTTTFPAMNRLTFHTESLE